MKVFGHRGFSGEYPENTMLAFQKAVEAGCEGIELDVQLTKDLVPVIMHDEKVDRTTDGNGYIYDLTYAELCKLDCSYPDKFAGKFGRLQIPTLREYLEWMAEEEDLITNIASIVLCRQSDETIAGGFLVEKYVDNAGVYARTCDVQYYHPNLEYLKEEHVRSCSQNGIGVNVWTVNEEEDMRRMKKWGVNSIITNYPDRGRAVADED